ncbi:cytochrome ubiquinol oxidase subunit I [Mixta theicola]|uniref:Cytochrome ubiquinol oxidase subunit I n=1 Tax=Mixta theicola TaxID=1458355 RepID=A0A2K1QDT9_9GAMM|nr:cytochrome ubiquinol oxidase subunit I [Mixta theicola]PNS13198.1 cytochrome ubiquinol oxidase subunit I [Mixta theicola]GLR09478.1 cytochrome ubiquinol oxidase subunit I [Mixta theicola]
MPDAELTLLLSRVQFAVTIGLHIILAGFSFGLSIWLVALEGAWLWRRQQRYLDLYNFWLKIFALNVAVGVVTGVVMEFQFGTNWAPFIERVGGLIGPMMFYEVLVAFFLEAGLMGVMMFGMGRIGPRLHFMVTVLVAIGALISVFWILAANSWMQTPAGFFLDEQHRFQPQSWMSIIFSPSFPWRTAHMLLAMLIGTAFMVAAAGAWQLLRHNNNSRARLMLTISLWLLPFLTLTQAVVGDLHGENTLEYQPTKIAAIEGDWQRPPPGEGEPLRLFALPDRQQQRNHWEIAIPQIGSLYLRRNLSGQIKSLREFPAEDIPPVAPVFFAFRLMVGLGVLMLAVSLTALIQRLRGRLWRSRWLLKTLVLMGPSGFIAMLSGWVVTEMGRQPWTVYGMVRTADSVSPISPHLAIASLCAILLVYGLVFTIGLRYLLHYASKAPQADEPSPAQEMQPKGGGEK